MQFHSHEEHEAALYDAAMLIVSTYNDTRMLEEVFQVDSTWSSYDFMKAARAVANHIANRPSGRD